MAALGIYPREMKACIHTKTHKIAALFAFVKNWKQPRCPPTGEWFTQWPAHVIKYYSAMKKEWSLDQNSAMTLQIIREFRVARNRGWGWLGIT